MSADVIEALRLVLPLAKGYVAAHPVGSNAAIVQQAEQALEAVDAEDICGFCGLGGADKMPHPMRWPGEQSADTELVHAACEDAECSRAHSLLSDKEREAFLRDC